MISCFRTLSLPMARQFCSISPPKLSFPQRLVSNGRWFFSKRVALPLPLACFGVYGVNSWMQTSLGTTEDFFSGSFITAKDPDALAEFYQAEDLLRIIAVFPFMFDIVMDKVVPDEKEATEETALLSLGETHFTVKFVGMDVSFEILEVETEDADGETSLTAFTRHERFIDWVPLITELGVKILMWDQTWKFGFDKLEDGTYEVYHHGLHFWGPWPIRFVIFVHQRYVLWACERFINGEFFGTEDLDRQQDQLACIPLHEIQAFITTLRSEKEKDIEMKVRSPIQDESGIAKDKLALENLKFLAERQTSISVSRRSQSRKSTRLRSFASKNAGKIVVDDTKTQEALATALKDAKGNTCVNDAIHRLIKNPDLHFEDRAGWKVERAVSRTFSRVSSKTD